MDPSTVFCPTELCRYNPMEVWDRGEDDKNGPHGACYW